MIQGRQKGGKNLIFQKYGVNLLIDYITDKSYDQNIELSFLLMTSQWHHMTIIYSKRTTPNTNAFTKLT